MFIPRIAMITFTSLLLIIVGALSVGHQQPDNPLLRDLDRCGDRVCAIGISPNITSFDAALAILRSHPNLEISPNIPSQANNRAAPFYEITLSTNPADGSVMRITLYFPPTPSLTASHIIAKFGSPCFLVPRPNSNQVALLYPDLMVFFNHPSNRTPNPTRFLPSPLMARVIVQASKTRECSQLEADLGALPWRGFRAYSR